MCNTSTSGLDTWDSNPDKGMEMFFFTTLPRIHLGPNLTPMKMTPESTFWLYHKADPCPLCEFWCRGNFFYFLLCKLFTSEIAPGSMPTKLHNIKWTLTVVFRQYYINFNTKGFKAQGRPFSLIYPLQMWNLYWCAQLQFDLCSVEILRKD